MAKSRKAKKQDFGSQLDNMSAISLTPEFSVPTKTKKFCIKLWLWPLSNIALALILVAIYLIESHQTIKPGPIISSTSNKTEIKRGESGQSEVAMCISAIKRADRHLKIGFDLGVKACNCTAKITPPSATEYYNFSKVWGKKIYKKAIAKLREEKKL